jgi:glycerate kinase
MLLSMRIVVAPDSFKGSLTADEAAAAIAGGVGRVLPDAEVLLRPVADGGEGTVAAALRAGYAARVVRVSGPDGRPVEAVLRSMPRSPSWSWPRPPASACSHGRPR